jgi:hypothetical protein
MNAKKLIGVACLAALPFAVSAVQAAPLSAALRVGSNVFSDDDAEVILKLDATTGTYRAFNLGTDTIGVGDILVGMVGLTSFPTGPLGSSSSLYNEGTGLYAVQVATAAGTTAASCGDGSGAVLTTCTNYSFTAAVGANAADPLNGALSLLNTIYGTTVGPVANTTANSFGAFFEDSTPDYTRSAPDYNTAFATAADGTLRMVLEQIAGNADFFVTTAPANPAELAVWNGMFPGANAGSFGGSGTIGFQDFPGWNLGPDINITGNLQGADSGPFAIWSDSTYRFPAARVPEPATVGLLGLGLLAITLVRRRKH